MQRTLVLAALGVALAALSWTRTAPENPISQFALTTPLAFDGHIVQRLAAGPYLYLEVETLGVRQWVATLAATCTPVSAVRIQVVARADRFHSALLARDFSPLSFGSVVALNQ